MTRPRSARLGAALLAAALAGGEAAAQGVIPIEEDGPDAAGPIRPPVAFRGGQPDLAPFDQRFGDLDDARLRLGRLLGGRLEEIDRVCDPTPSQRARLAIAGGGDIARFFDGHDEARLAHDAAPDQAARAAVIVRESARFNPALAGPGPFGAGSLLERTIRSTLDDSRRARLAAADRSRRESRHRASVAVAVGAIDRAVLLSADQRRRFSDLLLAETRPPRVPSQNNYAGMIYQASLIPESRLRPIFTAAQWPAVRLQLDQARNNLAILRSFGALPDPEPAPPAGGDRITRGQEPTR